MEHRIGGGQEKGREVKYEKQRDKRERRRKGRDREVNIRKERGKCKG
jgi:hypothetical protein